MKRRTKAEAAAFREQQAREVAERKAARAQKKLLQEAERRARRDARLAKREQRIAELAFKRSQRFELSVARKELITRDRTSSIISIIEGLRTHIEFFGEPSEVTINNIGRDIASSLKDLPITYSGLISRKALRTWWEYYQRGENYYPTHEHYNPNQVMGVRIVRHFLRKGFIARDRINIDPDLKAFLVEAVKVHKVTYKENLDLRRHQKEATFTTWQDSYNSCGIGELLAWPEGTNIADLPNVYPELT